MLIQMSNFRVSVEVLLRILFDLRVCRSFVCTMRSRRVVMEKLIKRGHMSAKIQFLSITFCQQSIEQEAVQYPLLVLIQLGVREKQNFDLRQPTTSGRILPQRPSDL